MANQDEMLRLARSEEVTPLVTRVFFAAMGRASQNGHAHFRRGELADVLGSVDTTTGEVRRQGGSLVTRAIRLAERRGYLTEGSTTTCLLLPSTKFRGGGRTAQRCEVLR